MKLRIPTFGLGAHFRSALDLFWTQKFRFLLTVSGIVVGVGSLLAMASMLSVGQEVLRSVSTQAVDGDLLTIENDWSVLNDKPNAQALSREDLRSVRDSVLLPDGRQVTATYGPREVKGGFGADEFTPVVMGVSPDALQLHNLTVARGRAFSTTELEEVRRMAIVGSKVNESKLSPGDVVRLNRTPYLVVGVFAEKADMGPGGQWSWNNRILVPATTYRMDFAGSTKPNRIAVKMAPPVGYDGLFSDYMVAAQKLTDVVLSQGRSIKSWETSGADEQDNTEAVIFDTIRALLYLTTVFSMLVGGINIMNIMLVTVTERTREIGTRRALGASQRDVLRQFLAETVMVTLIGAAMGVVGGVGLVALGSAAMNAWVTTWPFRIELWSVFVGIGFSSGIGLVFGMYPAWRASRLDPVEALRHD